MMDFEDVKMVTKYTKRQLSDIITEFIGREEFKDRQAEKRRFLTDLEVKFNTKIEEYLKAIKEEIDKRSPPHDQSIG